MARYRLSLPARINVLGNPADGNEGDHQTISVAIDVRAGAWVEPADVLQFDEYQRGPDGELHLARHIEDATLALADDGQAVLQKAALRRLLAHSPEFAAAFGRRKVRLATWTDVPRQSGLGGSSLPVLLTLAGMRAAYGLDRGALNDYVMAEMAQRVEAIDLGITCGYADRYVPLFGGLAYIDYRGKVKQQALDAEPYCTYERLDAYASAPPIVVCSTGLDRNSGDVHGIMRGRYLEELAAYERAGNGQVPFMLRIMADIGATAWRGKIGLLKGDWATFGALMNENHQLVNEMMAYCGLRDGGVTVTNRLIGAALEAGALGAKLTGAGGGGSVFALVPPGREAHVADAFRRTAQDEGLDQSVVFVPGVARQGLQVEEE